MATILVSATQMTATGGIENHLVRFCERLASAGASITFLCADYRPSLGLHIRLRRSCCRLIVLSSHQHPPRGFIKALWLVWANLRLKLLSFDTLYLNGQGSLPFWIWKGFGWRCKRTVVHHHSSGEPDDVVTWTYGYHKLLREADAVIACSHSNARLIETVLHRPVRIIYCFSEPCSSVVCGAASTPLAFGFIGRLIPEKGVDIILRLSTESSLSDIHWHLWGSSEVYQSGFADAFPNVTMHPPFDNHEGLEEAMAQLDAFTLFSTHREGLPLTLLEAMSAGVPWIAADRGGIRDLLIDDDCTVLLPKTFSYEDALRASCMLADKLRHGSIRHDALVDAYWARFHPDTLVDEWSDLLFRKPA